TGAARAGLQLLPLRPRSVGQLFGVFRRHGLHSVPTGLAGGRTHPGEWLLPVGPADAGGLRVELRGQSAVTSTEGAVMPTRTPARPRSAWLLVSLFGGMFLGNVDIAIVNIATPS